MSATDIITQARLKELLSYDPGTGLFVWTETKSGWIKKGAVAGYTNVQGYVVIKIDGVQYKAHRLAFLYMLGYMPDEVDHDNQIRHDNRWDNLNPATGAVNTKNKSLYRSNISGHVGVYQRKQGGKWAAQIMNIHLGYFTHKQDAIAARAAADIKYGFHDNHGEPAEKPNKGKSK